MGSPYAGSSPLPRLCASTSAPSSGPNFRPCGPALGAHLSSHFGSCPSFGPECSPQLACQFCMLQIEFPHLFAHTMISSSSLEILQHLRIFHLGYATLCFRLAFYGYVNSLRVDGCLASCMEQMPRACLSHRADILQQLSIYSLRQEHPRYKMALLTHCHPQLMIPWSPNPTLLCNFLESSQLPALPNPV